ncbi:MAG: SnoaL-like domain-containing protein [Kofleriaceae bacterium]
MTTLEIGKKLVALCNEGQNHVAMETLYAPDIVSVEAGGPPGTEREARGIAAVAAKGKQWIENHTVHSAKHDGPYPNGDQFIVKLTYDITNKPSGKRMLLEEMGLYTVKNDKIVHEAFFYSMG